MNATDRLWLDQVSEAAEASGHIFPTIAACEAALESNFGRSLLAAKDNNLFGMKQHVHPVYGTEKLPTREFQNGEWVMVEASWVHYPDWKSCFSDRMLTLIRMAAIRNKDGSLAYPHYEAALETPDCMCYLREVSKTWSTDPKRADKVTDIYDDYMGLSAA